MDDEKKAFIKNGKLELEKEDIKQRRVSANSIVLDVCNECNIVSKLSPAAKLLSKSKSTLNNNNNEGDEEDKVSLLNKDGLNEGKIILSPNSNGISIPNQNESPIPELKEVKVKVRKGWRRYVGIICSLISSLFFSIATLLVKVLQLKDYPTLTLGIWRFQGILYPTILLVFYALYVEKKNIFEPIWPPTEKGKWKTIGLLMIRGITGATAVLFAFYSLQYLSISDSQVIVFSTPVFVTLTAHLFLGEECAIVPVLSAFLTLFGVFFIARPPLLTGSESFDKDNLIGIGFAVVALFMATLTFVVLRSLRKLHYSLVTLAFGIWGSSQFIILHFFLGGGFVAPKNSTDLCLGLLLAFLTFLGQSFFTLAIKFEEAGIVSILRTFDIIFCFCWQIIFLSAFPDIWSILGSSIVILSVLIVGFRKYIQTLPSEKPTRRFFNFLLI